MDFHVAVEIVGAGKGLAAVCIEAGVLGVLFVGPGSVWSAISQSLEGSWKEEFREVVRRFFFFFGLDGDGVAYVLSGLVSDGYTADGYAADEYAADEYAEDDIARCGARWEVGSW